MNFVACSNLGAASSSTFVLSLDSAPNCANDGTEFYLSKSFILQPIIYSNSLVGEIRPHVSDLTRISAIERCLDYILR